MLSSLDFESRIARALYADRHRLRRLAQSIEQAQRTGRPFDRNLSRLNDELERSTALRQARELGRPRPTFDNDLPISARRDEIAAAIAAHQVVIVCGETGSGKSTQLPKICLELGRGVEGMIAHTQPRRIAARSIAARVAQELGTQLGSDVGFKVRFTDVTNPRTYIKLMTDGILLAESQADRFLSKYDTIILDEAHERSLNIDFLLGYLVRLLPQRPELKLIVTSATIDAERFAQHFAAAAGEVPIVEVSGRSYPVEIRHRPPAPEADGAEPDVERAMLEAIDELAAAGPGDMLVFMPSEQDIHAASKALRGRRIPGPAVEVMPLYARLSTAEQNKVFSAHTGRRIVIATNVAESSLTVPGIRYVIDTGTARISRFSSRQRVQRLPIEPVSQASARQRAGRCGRVGPGICIRLYSEDDFQGREAFTPPEIQRSNLAAVILRARSLRFGSLDDFPFLDPPRPEAIRSGNQTLFELGAVDENQELTDLGQALARLPVDPRIGRILLAGDAEGCLHEILIIASALSVQDPRDRPLDKQQAADEAHARHQDTESDFLGLLKLWDFYHELREHLSENKLRKACREHFLSYHRMREWLDVHRQLLRLLADAGLYVEPRRGDAKAIHRALLTGFLSSIGQRHEGSEYRVAGGMRAQLWPGSATFGERPKWVVAAEIVETSRRYLRTVGRINPHWIEPLAAHLLDRTYGDVHWDPTAGSAMAMERVELFGLVVVPRRRVRLGPIDPVEAREMFILHALVRGGYQTRGKFLAHNAELLQSLEQLARKSRRHDYLRGEDARYRFYDERIPAEVVDGASFERWRRDAERDDPRRLCMSQSDLLLPQAETVDPSSYPDAISVRQMRLPLDYRHAPGTDQDGITITVPQEGFAQLDPVRLEWLVPGLVEEKIASLIRSLEKPLRRHFVPVADTVKRVMAEVHFGEGSLAAAVAFALTRLSGVEIRPEHFDLERLPPHLRIRVRVADSAGRTVAAGRDLSEIRRHLVHEAAWESAARGDDRWQRQGITTWDFGPLEKEVQVRRGPLVLGAYPALVDEGSTAALRLMTTPAAAERASRGGVRRLYSIAHARELATQVDWLPNLNQLLVQASGLGGAKLKPQIADLVADRAFLASDPLPREREAFESRRSDAAQRIGLAVQEVVQVLAPLVEAYHQVRLASEGVQNPQWAYVAADVRSQLEHLLAPGFLTATPWSWLVHVPRYLRAIRVRWERLAGGGRERDERSFRLVLPRWQSYLNLARQHAEHGIVDPELERYRWLVEEFRVSLFAQQLGTSLPISEKRLDEQWRQVSLL